MKWRGFEKWKKPSYRPLFCWRLSRLVQAVLVLTHLKHVLIHQEIPTTFSGMETRRMFKAQILRLGVIGVRPATRMEIPHKPTVLLRMANHGTQPRSVAPEWRSSLGKIVKAIALARPVPNLDVINPLMLSRLSISAPTRPVGMVEKEKKWRNLSQSHFFWLQACHSLTQEAQIQTDAIGILKLAVRTAIKPWKLI